MFRICITFGGHRHCFDIPIISLPVHFHVPGPGPVNYPQLLQDGLLMSSMHDTIKKVADAGVRKALETGFGTAVAAMQKRAGDQVTISVE